MTLDGSISENCLFLVCPMDQIEGVLTRAYKGRAFFYTALGCCFEWDKTTQKSIVSFMEYRKVDQITFITKVTNQFYGAAFKKRVDTASFPVQRELAALQLAIPDHIQDKGYPMSKSWLLAARHLKRQERHLLNTSFLGDLLTKHQVTVKSMVYDPDKKVFKTPDIIERKALVHSWVSLN